MFVVDNILVDDRIKRLHFACDLTQCKGICCTFPGPRGAPIQDSERVEIERAFPVIRKYLSERSLSAIATKGLYEGKPGNFATTCVEEDECVFVVWEDDIAKCAFELAYRAGEICWRKPLSCHLFPLRVTGSEGGVLRYHHIPECGSAIARGEREHVHIIEFLKEALVRAYGALWYEHLLEATTLNSRLQSAEGGEDNLINIVHGEDL